MGRRAYANPELCTPKHREWVEKNKEKVRQYNRERSLGRKRQVLTYYSPNKVLCCSWLGCFVDDIDMLSLDHLDNNGARDIRGSGKALYNSLIRENFPSGFQTLCYNHQWKKEITRLKTEPRQSGNGIVRSYAQRYRGKPK